MPWWVRIAIVVCIICSAVPYHYARHLSRGQPDGRPQWYLGFANLYLVTGILKDHAERGNRRAQIARVAYCIATAGVPAVLLGLVVREYWSR